MATGNNAIDKLREEYKADLESDNERIKLSFDYRAGEINEILQDVSDDLSKTDFQSMLAIEQVKATLLLAEQTQRIADALEEMGGRDSLVESVRIWGSE